jgi:hypothetical protein
MLTRTGQSSASRQHSHRIDLRGSRLRSRLRRLTWASTAALVAAGLLAVYVRLSDTYPVTSNSANILLMASDMLHGNLLLHGWFMSDVSFYTTEIPQYALLELFFGVHPATAHLAAAMTYTLALVFAVLLAGGPRPASRTADGPGDGSGASQHRVARTLIVCGIMLAPQLGAGVANLDLAVGHIGTSVPLLLIWLLLDRAGSTASSWRIPALVAIGLGWVLIADPLVLLIAVAPVLIVTGVRIVHGIATERSVRIGARERRDELLLGGAALAGVALAWGIERLLAALGGYVLQAIPFTVMLPRLWPQLHTTFWCVLQLFGADPRGLTGIWLGIACLHGVSLVLVGAALFAVGRRFLNGVRLVDHVLAVAIVLNVAIFAATSASGAGPHELAVIVPFGAALAARMLADRWASRVPAGGRAAGTLVLAGYLAGLGCELAQPAVPPDNERIASWLAAHHLGYGLGVFSDSSSITIDSGGLVRVRPLEPVTLPLEPRWWMADQAWYDAGANRATFLVFHYGHSLGNWVPPRPLLARYLGNPSRVYYTGRYIVLVWDKNLLRDVR